MPRGPKGEKRPAQDRNRRDRGHHHRGREERGRRGAGAHGRQGAGRGHVGEEAERDRQEGRRKTLGKVKESACKQAEAPQEGDGFLSVAESAQEPDRYGDESSANP
jgi:hypothetical protein